MLLKSKAETKTGIEKTVEEAKVIKSPREVLVLDSDDDELKDWEETLWGLDPHKKDTNDDGVSDAEEVKKRMKMIDASALDKGSGGSEFLNSQYATDTETAMISKKLFAEYINLKQSGNLNDETINATANNLVAEEIRNKKTIQYYFLKNIKTFSSEDNDILKTYGNSLVSIRIKYEKIFLQDPMSKEGGAEANLIDPELVKGLVRISDNFKNMANEMSRLAVPEKLADNHLKILNNYMANSDGLREISMLSTDPVVAMIGMQRQTEAEANEKPLLKTVAEYLNENDIFYSKNEPGYSLNTI